MSFAQDRVFSKDIHLLALEPGIFQAYKPPLARQTMGNGIVASSLLTVTGDLIGRPLGSFGWGDVVNLSSDSFSGSFAIVAAAVDGLTLSTLSPSVFDEPPSALPVWGPDYVSVSFAIYSFAHMARLAADDLMRRLGLDPLNAGHAQLITPGANCQEWSALATMERIYRARMQDAASVDRPALQSAMDVYATLATRAFNRMRLIVTDPDGGESREVIPGHIQLQRA